jgi:hypothetical protein
MQVEEKRRYGADAFLVCRPIVNLWCIKLCCLCLFLHLSCSVKACIELSFEDLPSFSVHVNVWIGLYMKVYSPRHGCDVKLVMSMEGIIDK